MLHFKSTFDAGGVVSRYVGTGEISVSVAGAPTDTIYSHVLMW